MLRKTPEHVELSPVQTASDLLIGVRLNPPSREATRPSVFVQLVLGRTAILPHYPLGTVIKYDAYGYREYPDETPIAPVGLEQQSQSSTAVQDPSLDMQEWADATGKMVFMDDGDVLKPRTGEADHMPLNWQPHIIHAPEGDHYLSVNNPNCPLL